MYQPEKFHLFIASFLLLATVACHNNVVMEKSMKIEGESWDIDEIKVFEKEFTDTVSLYDMYFNVRNNHEYPYSNLFVFFHTEFPDGRIFKDTLEMILADRQGKWTGKGFGKIKSNSFHFRKDVWFPLEGTYKFSVQHAMRDEELTGITDVGIRIEKK